MDKNKTQTLGNIARENLKDGVPERVLLVNSVYQKECSKAKKIAPARGGPTKAFQILIYIAVFIASWRRGKIALSTPRGSSVISYGDMVKIKSILR